MTHATMNTPAVAAAPRARAWAELVAIPTYGIAAPEIRMGDVGLFAALVAALVVAIILILVYRSPFIWIIPLLSAGIAENIDALLKQRFGAQPFTVTTLEENWSENLAKWLLRISPVLLGLGIMALYIEFKTPGFGIFGVAGITLLALVFLSTYAAGLSGHEPILVFLLGVVLVVVELALELYLLVQQTL